MIAPLSNDGDDVTDNSAAYSGAADDDSAAVDYADNDGSVVEGARLINEAYPRQIRRG